MEELKFENFHLSKEIVQAVSDMGFEEMSQIQSQTIPFLLDGIDVIGQAKTGTGKTAAFGIPIVEKTDPNNRSVQAMVLCPTRELCIQVAEEISKLSKYKKGISVLPIYGGQPIDRQIRGLRKGVQIVIGTPGRVIDHIHRKTLRLDQVKLFVLDEADEMFDMGFREDIELVIQELPEERQTTFFSATMAKDIMDFASKYQRDPKIIKIIHKEMTVPEVEQFYYDLRPHMKTEILARVLDIYNPRLTLVFCNTKKKVDELTVELHARGYSADGLHGDLKQTQRDAVMNKFRRGTIDILVATDVAARGIDVDDVDLVINYDMPQDNEYYVHRIGRTARAGRKGMAISFVSGRDAYNLRDIQRFTKTKIFRRDLPTLQDIEKKQISKMIEMVRTEIEKGEFSQQEKVLNLLLEEDYGAYEVAAASLKLYMTENKLESHEELDYVDFNKRDVREWRDHGDRDHRRKKDFRNKKDDWSKKNASHYTRIYLNVGKRKNISQRHILSALLEETGIEKRDIGQIEIYDKFAFVEVPKKLADEVVHRMNHKHIKGFKVNVEKANPRE